MKKAEQGRVVNLGAEEWRGPARGRSWVNSAPAREEVMNRMAPLDWHGGVSYVLLHDHFWGKFRPVSNQNGIFLTASTEACTWTHNPSGHSWPLESSLIVKILKQKEGR